MKPTWRQWLQEKTPLYGIYICVQRIAGAAGGIQAPAGYPGGADKLKHCVATCEIARQCFSGSLGSGTAALAVGGLKEVADMFKNKGHASIADMLANASGSICSGVSVCSCECCCRLGGNCP